MSIDRLKIGLTLSVALVVAAIVVGCQQDNEKDAGLKINPAPAGTDTKALTDQEKMKKASMGTTSNAGYPGAGKAGGR